MYNETNWVTGDIITAEKLNNIEEGITSINDGFNHLVDVQDEQPEHPVNKIWVKKTVDEPVVLATIDEVEQITSSIDYLQTMIEQKDAGQTLTDMNALAQEISGYENDIAAVAQWKETFADQAIQDLQDESTVVKRDIAALSAKVRTLETTTVPNLADRVVTLENNAAVINSEGILLHGAKTIAGAVEVELRSKNAVSDLTITFPYGTFSAPPIVQATLRGVPGQTYVIGYASVSVVDSTATQCTIRINNYTGAGRWLGVYWMAMGV